MLDASPADRRASPAQENEMIRWASLGVTRVQHVLSDSGRRALTLDELALRHPRLVGRGETRDRVSRMYTQVLKNLKRCTS